MATISLRILIVPDKFKGSLTARQATAAIARGWRLARPADSLDLLPMSDGGDGFGEVLGGLLGAHPRQLKTLDAAHRSIRCPWWWLAKRKIAIVESAKIIGLAGLPPRKFHPFQLDTFGLGTILRAAEKAGARRCVVGLGGSATNDGGFGLARALGWQFFGYYGEPLEEWWQLAGLSGLRPPSAPLLLRVIAAVDAANPLLGPSGCSRIFGLQKGLRPEDIDLTEKCLARLAAVLRKECHLGHPNAPGAGAAGGLGFGLNAFAGARTVSGFDLFARRARLEMRIRSADVVITGEGTMDEQTRMGKGVGRVARMCAARGVPCIGLAGVVHDVVKAGNLFAHTRALTEITALPKAQRQAADVLHRLSQETARAWPVTYGC